MPKWEDNIKNDFRERLLEGVFWIHLVQSRYRWWALANKAMELWVH
jgi:hypothetical protein